MIMHFQVQALILITDQQAAELAAQAALNSLFDEACADVENSSEPLSRRDFLRGKFRSPAAGKNHGNEYSVTADNTEASGQP